ncbi:MAG: M20 family metallopeptidase [Sedimentisphaerales bacterium]|nr:M20 family metallopeptidase [Sedimentisphaerales bacterium]
MKKLIQAESAAQNGELAAAQVISEEFTRSGIDCQIDCWDQNRANVVAVVKSKGQKAGLLFICHLDVVAAGERGWNYPPFAAVESDGRIYGRGAADMKGGIAAAVTAIRQIVDSKTKLKGDIVFAALAGEETDSGGAVRFANDLSKKSPKLTGIIVPELTDFDVFTAHRGILWLEVKTFGKAAHGSAPELGVNAITSMKHLLNELDNYKIRFEPHKLLGNSSMSINTIAGGKEINVVPDNCTVGIDIRTLPGQKSQEIISDFEKIFAKLKRKNPQFEASVSVARELGSLETDPDCDFVKDFCSCVGADQTKAVSFTTDGPHFASFGVPIVIFGPGKPPLAHKPDEYIDIADLEKAVEYYKKAILKFLT